MPRARTAMAIRIVPLGTASQDDLSASTTAAERLAMVLKLTHQGWALAQRTIPTYTRAEAPMSLVPLDPRSSPTR
ncbi:MAG TPA: hypothetical protein VNU46_04765 [Gemmatimonadaceae bacterium]|nr:hypothetical protein [Gemmatimonadaceae bacterium]